MCLVQHCHSTACSLAVCLPQYNLSCIYLAGGKSHHPVTHIDYFVLRNLLWFVLSQGGKKAVCGSHCVRPLSVSSAYCHNGEKGQFLSVLFCWMLLEEVSSLQRDSQLIWPLGKLWQYRPTFHCWFFSLENQLKNSVLSDTREKQMSFLTAFSHVHYAEVCYLNTDLI